MCHMLIFVKSKNNYFGHFFNSKGKIMGGGKYPPPLPIYIRQK